MLGSARKLQRASNRLDAEADRLRAELSSNPEN
jgi:hypothetical protein